MVGTRPAGDPLHRQGRT